MSAKKFYALCPQCGATRDLDAYPKATPPLENWPRCAPCDAALLVYAHSDVAGDAPKRRAAG